VTTAAKGKGKRKEKKILSLQTKQGSASCGIAALRRRLLHFPRPGARRRQEPLLRRRRAPLPRYEDLSHEILLRAANQTGQ